MIICTVGEEGRVMGPQNNDLEWHDAGSGQLDGSTEAWATPTKTLFESTSFF